MSSPPRSPPFPYTTLFRSALPGDPLYGVKREVEELRMEIAPPSVRPMLAAMALDERLSEVERLASAGNWTRVALAEGELQIGRASCRERGWVAGWAGSGRV